jgi:nucleoside-diphosphate-sugar epimerase
MRVKIKYLTMPPSNISKLKVGLTGSTGFIGAAFLKQYSETYDIRPINLRNPNFISQIPDLDGLVHCAGLAHQDNPPPKETYFEVNYDFTKKLVDACIIHQVKQFIFLSTFHVNLKNPTSYSESKLAAETYLNSVSSQISISIIRPPMVYGEGCKGNFPKLVKLMKLSLILPFNYKKNRRSLIYVENLTGFISHLLNQNIAGTFSPQDEKTVSIYDLALYISEGLKQKKILIAFPEWILKFIQKIVPTIYDRLFDDLYVEPAINVEKTGYTPQIPTQIGIHKTVQALLAKN